jgi:plasmid replication initiation protein
MEEADQDFRTRNRQPTQQNLFRSDDLILPQSVTTMRKAVAAIHTTPTTEESNFTFNGRRLADALILIAVIDCKERGLDFIQRIRNERLSPAFEVRVTELARVAGIPGKNYQRDIYDQLDRLYSTELAWNIVSEDKTVAWRLKAHFLSMLGIGENDKRGMIRFAFDPEILIILLEPSQWAKITLKNAQGLGSAAAYALYTNAIRYFGTKHKVTAALPTETWIELLIGRSKYIVETDGKRVVNYGEFKRRVLTDALKRINESPALPFALKLRELKVGNRIAKLQFQFEEKNQYPIAFKIDLPDDLVDCLVGIGYSQREIDELGQLHSYETVSDALYRLKQSETRMRAEGRAITARKAYFTGILRNIAGGVRPDELDHQKIEEEARQHEIQQQNEDRRIKLQAKYEEHLKTVFRDWLFGLSVEARDALIREYRESDQCNPAIAKTIDKGLSDKNLSAMTFLRLWMKEKKPEIIERIFSTPDTQSLESWTAWTLAASFDA